MDFSCSVAPVVANTNSLAMRGVMNWDNGQCAPQLPIVPHAPYVSRHRVQSTLRQGSCVVGHSTRCDISDHTYSLPRRTYVSRCTPYSSYHHRHVAHYSGPPRLNMYRTVEHCRTGFNVSPHPPSYPYERIRSYIPSLSGGKKKDNAMYRVIVTTGDKEDAGTEAKVYLHLHGTKGKLPKQLLTGQCNARYKRRRKFKFNRDTTLLFKFLKKDIGDLTKIKIEVDGKTKRDGWYLDQIEITKRIPGTRAEKSWFFSCYNWLSLYMGDCQLTRIIPAKLHIKTDYKIVVITGNIKGAGTDANVFITIFGEIGQTPKLQLKNKDKDSFESGRKAMFILRTARVGPMTRIRIQHDNTGERPNWYLERIIVTDVGHPEWEYHFPCNQWLAKSEGDGLISRVLLGSFTDYEVVVVTGNLKGAGTDANVFLTIFGDAGQTPKMQLTNNSKDVFDRDHSDTFQLSAASVGPMTKIRIEHDNSGSNPDWFLSRIVVTDLKCPERKYYFTCNKWLAIQEEDGQVCRDLPGTLDPLVIHTDYEVLVFTGDIEGAGTDANVFLTIYGEAGETEKVQLRNNEKHLFDRNHTDTFIITSVCVGPMLKCRIEQDNSGANPRWYLERIVITDQKCPKWKYYFPCDKWLAADRADNRTYRLLVGSLNPPPARTDYNIVVSTGDLKGAGTDANVYITIFGEAGQTPKLPLKNDNNDAFGRKQTDVFTLKASCVGQVTKLWIEHDSTGSDPDWFLDMIEITDTKHEERRFYFACGQWLNKGDNDQPVCRELTASSEAPIVLPEYEVAVYTGDAEDAGTDANVFITIFGEDRQTPKLALKNNNKNTFDRKHKDTFFLKVTSVGPVSKVRMEHDNSGSDSSWFLKKIVVKELKQPYTTYAFPCDKWFSLSEGDRQIHRDLYITQTSPEAPPTDEKYVVLVCTGDIEGGGTNANVFITIFGTNAQTLKFPLKNNDRNCFGQKQSATFLLETPGVGSVTKIRIEHDDTGPDPDWYLEKVQITEWNHPDIYHFHCDEWLSKKRGDKEIFQELSSSTQPARDHTQYEVVVFTGDVKNAGTDANVFITLFGEKGVTDKYQLKYNNTDTFDRKHRDTFILRALYIGQLSKIRIEHDNAGSAPDWFLDKIEVSDLKRPEGKTFHAPCNQWLSQNDGDKSICRDLPVSDPPPELTKYEAVVYTGGVRGAGTDANVFIKLYSATGETPELRLSDNNKDTFNENRTDRFKFDSIYLGPLTKIRVKHDDTGSSPGWFLKKIEVTDLKHPAHVYTFPCGQWLDKNEDDKQICRELPVCLIPVADVLYAIEVKTRHKEKAGTAAKWYIIMYGGTDLEHNSGKILLENGRLHREGGATFDVKADINLCPLSKITIGYDRSGSSSRWFLEKVVVTCPSAALEESFECHEWIPTGKGDHNAERTIEINGPKKVRYTIHVTTGQKENADTSAKVYVILYGGQDGKLTSQKLWLENGMFRKGRTDTFHVYADIYLCPLSQLKIGHDSSGHDPRWFLDRVMVNCPSAGLEAYFECHKWISKVDGDRDEAEEIIEAKTSIPPKDTTVKWTLSIKTSDVSGAGTDANILLSIYDKNGVVSEPKEIKLDNEGKHFKGNALDEFKIVTKNIRKPDKIRVSHDGTGRSPNWHLEEVAMKNVASNKSYVFPCGRWLARDIEDGSTIRELWLPKRSVPQRISKGSVPQQNSEGSVPQQNSKGSVPQQNSEGSVPQRISKSSVPQQNSEGSVPQQNSTGSVQHANSKDSELYRIEIKHDNIVIANPVTDMRLKIFRDNGGPLTTLVENVNKATNVFTITHRRNVETDYQRVAKPQKVQIFYDTHKKAAKWFPDLLTVSTPTTSEKETFACPAWLTTTPDNRSALTRYEIKSWVRDGFRAGPDAEIKIQIFGEVGKTREHTLNFERGEIYPSKIETVDVGQLMKLRISHQCKRECGGWFLKELLIQCTKRHSRRHSVGTEFRRRQSASPCRHHTSSCRHCHDIHDDNHNGRRPRQRRSTSAQFRHQQTSSTKSLERCCCQHHTERLRYTDDEGKPATPKSDNKRMDRYSDADDTDRGKGKAANEMEVSAEKKNKYDSDSDARTSNKPKTRGTHSKFDSDDDDGAEQTKKPAPRESRKECKLCAPDGGWTTTDSEDDPIEEYWFVFDKQLPCEKNDKPIIWELMPTDRRGKALDTSINQMEYIIQAR